MNSLQATLFEKKHNVTGIDSEDPGVHYFLDGSRMGVVIAGEEGYVGLTLEQALLDGLNGVAYLDDKQIVRLESEKRFSELGKVIVKVYEVENEKTGMHDL